MAALYISLGVLIGFIGILLLGFYASRKDNRKFDTSKPMTPRDPITGYDLPQHWPEGYVTPPETMWQSTTVKTTFTNGNQAEGRGSKRKANEKPLEDQLKEALEAEEYMKAAEIRDKIKNKKTK